MDTLNDRREAKCLKCAKGCINNNQMKNMFPLNKNKKKREKYKVNHARTVRYQNSTIIHMQKLLNKDIESKRKIKISVDKACSREARLQYSSFSVNIKSINK